MDIQQVNSLIKSSSYNKIITRVKFESDFLIEKSKAKLEWTFIFVDVLFNEKNLTTFIYYHRTHKLTNDEIIKKIDDAITKEIESRK